MRYVVELENNHHYIVIDTVTGSSYFTPAQEDANALASIMNNYEKKLKGQKGKIKEYKGLLSDNKIIYVKNNDKGECSECVNSYLTILGGEDKIYCSELDDTFSIHHTCDKFVKE